jgi:signal transduction histidine kinase
VISADADIKKLRDNFQPIYIDAVVSKAVESIQPHAIRKDIEIVPSIAGNLRPIHGDEITFVEALVNLLGNAVKYSRMGSQILISAEEKDDEIFIAVSDRGVGISEDDLPFIFGDFYIGKSAPEEERGSGLGLGITQRIVGAHNGSISVESALDKGSTFMIRFPVIKTDVHNEPALNAGILINN